MRGQQRTITLTAAKYASEQKSNQQPIELDYQKLRKVVITLRAVNHETRRAIIQMLEENESLTVTDIYIKQRLEQSVASQHLAILRKQGIVATKRNGKFIHYYLQPERIKEISRLVDELAE